MGVLPGDAPQAALNLQAMSRPMAVIGPLLREGLRQFATTEVSPAGQRQQTMAILRADARSRREVQAVRAGLAAAADRARSSPSLDGELAALAQLCLGLDRIALTGADDRDLLSSVRPLRSRAQRIDAEMRNGRVPGSVLGYGVRSRPGSTNSPGGSSSLVKSI